MNKSSEQTLIDTMFSLVLTAYSTDRHEEKARWVRQILAQLGYFTIPMGISWGIIVDEERYYRHQIENDIFDTESAIKILLEEEDVYLPTKSFSNTIKTASFSEDEKEKLLYKYADAHFALKMILEKVKDRTISVELLEKLSHII